MLGAHAGSLYRNVVARTRDLGASGDRAPVRQQPWLKTKSRAKMVFYSILKQNIPSGSLETESKRAKEHQERITGLKFFKR